MKYFVTFATTDDTLGNPLWHSFLLLSTIDETTGAITVVDNWGFYGVPSTIRNGLISNLKIKFGLDIDMTDNHGLLKHEELRFLDLGRGLHGLSFELSEEKFNQLEQRCLKQVMNQQQAIKDYSKGITGKSPKSTRLYPQEELSQIIYTLEKKRAAEAGEPSRLKPFEVRLGWTFWGPTLKESFTCKSMALELLQGILPPEHIALLTENGKHPTVPKYSGPQEKIYLTSSGPMRQHTKRSGDIVYYRDFDDDGVKLEWTLPPQNMITTSNDTKSMLQTSPYYVEDVKELIEKLQQLEWLFINANIDQKYESYRQSLIQRIRGLYLSFNKPDDSSITYQKSTCEKFFLNLLHLPRDQEENSIYKKIMHIKSFINMLYMFMIDNLQIQDDLPCEVDLNDNDLHTTEYNYLEFLASHLNSNDQQRLCHIIGRTYIDNMEEDDEVQEIEFDDQLVLL